MKTSVTIKGITATVLTLGLLGTAQANDFTTELSKSVKIDFTEYTVELIENIKQEMQLSFEAQLAAMMTELQQQTASIHLEESKQVKTEVANVEESK
ncbi:hypothetical protein D5018_16785 [Parashewanella curva]|uniref:Uncharacterized protein n=1 Tax=Parashewanella curva TaxID=2338552 RepID=A0A3L8PUQ1_9GAMM|nr:hypothetical protein [Parashewanella curva]RLV58549.1 hypothetical protein D5018_16785 [Parashewanella curva]